MIVLEEVLQARGLSLNALGAHVWDEQHLASWDPGPGEAPHVLSVTGATPTISVLQARASRLGGILSSCPGDTRGRLDTRAAVLTTQVLPVPGAWGAEMLLTPHHAQGGPRAGSGLAPVSILLETSLSQ